MSLLDEYNDSYIVMNKAIVDDGYGGYTTVWQEGVTIEGALAPANEQEVVLANAMGEKTTHTFVFDKGIQLEYHDVIKRESDGQIFRVTSSGGEAHTPSSSPLNLKKVTLEAWELPIGG